MKKIFVFFTCLTIFLNAKVYYKGNITIDKSKGYIVYVKGTKDLVTGKLKKFYDDNKTLYSITPLKDGKIDGIFKVFYKDSKLKAKIYYKNSKRNGKHIIYFKNGKKAYEADMKNEKKDGHVKEWYDNGQLMYDILYRDNKPEGMVKIFDKNGSIQMISEYKNGKRVKQIQPKKPNNMLLQTRALFMYGNGKDIYYLFMSPICPHCKEFFSKIDKYKDKVTFYVYAIPLNPKNKIERKILNIIYAQPSAEKKIEMLKKAENGTLDLEQNISKKQLFFNSLEIAKAQQIQLIMKVRAVPKLIDTKGFEYSAKDFYKKYSK